MASQVEDVDGIEIVYPQDFTDVQQTIQMVKDSGTYHSHDSPRTR